MAARKTPPVREPDGQFAAKDDRTPTVSFQNELNKGVVYQVTEPLALVYAKLLHVGCPPIRAVLYCIPELAGTAPGLDVAKKVSAQWNVDAIVLAAIANINGGQWHELEYVVRVKLALQKSNAEAAFYAWTNNFSDLTADELVKLKLARDIMKAELGQSPDEADGMQAFARFAMDLARNMAAEKTAKGKKAPELVVSGLDKLLSEQPKREM